MTVFDKLRNDTISIQRDGKTIYENLKCSLSSDEDNQWIRVDALEMDIREGDEVIRYLPNEKKENYVVLEARFNSGKPSGIAKIPPNYKLLVEKQGVTKPNSKTEKNQTYFVDPKRIDGLKKIISPSFDFKKLISICEELNVCSSKDAFYSMAMLQRSIIDHIPPVLGCRNFAEVSNNYAGGSRSFKAQMAKLDDSLRKIADQHLHTHIRSSESLPTRVQVDFSNDLDVLLAEIVRIS